jgi:heme/copper-type cytochrome/quinol oxidase subunit 1
MLISLPTGSKMFNWLSSYLITYQVTYQVTFNNLSIIYIKMFLIMFTLGGSTGLILGNNVIDICLHDTYYVVSHFHVVLSLGTLLAIFIGVSYYQEFLIVKI